MEPRETGLSEVGRAIQSALERETHLEADLAAGRARLLERSMKRERSTLRNRLAVGARAWAAPLVFVALSGLAAWAWFARPLSFQVGAAALSGRLGDVVQTSGSSLPLAFSDGSSVVLHDGGRARVLAADAGGARVLLEHGELDVSIEHRVLRATHWSFDAGPFRVLVTGTRFVVGYEPATQKLVLNMKAGSVVVAGSCLGQTRTVSGAGAKLELECPRAASARAEAPSAADAGAEVPAAPAPPLPAVAADSVAPPAARAASGVSGEAASWRESLRAGRGLEALSAAERAGFDAACQLATRSELLDFADAARLSRRTNSAMSALLALRRRFPGSADAATAAFALGRIAFDQRGDYAAAANWFKAYLDEAPRGALVGDALGRLMEARARGGDRSGARSEAERYLKRFPEGPYAAQARRILD